MQAVTIATKIPGEIEQIIANLYLKYFYNRMISLGDMVSSSFVVFARMYCSSIRSGMGDENVSMDPFPFLQN